MNRLDLAYQYLYIAALTLLAVAALIALIRAIKGPRVADRIMGINMIGTITIMMIAILSKYLEESYLLDVCIIYAMISFLAVVVLCKVYITVHLKKKRGGEGE